MHFFHTGSPKYFEPILHYLRTNVPEVPPGLSRASLRSEAEFYGIQKLVDHLDHLAEMDKAKNESPKKGKYVLQWFHSELLTEAIVHIYYSSCTVVPIPKDLGCYVNATNDHAFLFGAEDKVTCISGYEAFTQAMVRSSQLDS